MRFLFETCFAGESHENFKALKIVRIVPFLDFGGVEQRVKLTAFGFNAFEGVKLSIIVLGSGGRVTSELESVGIYPRILQHRIKIPCLKLIFDLYQIFSKDRPDVVHTSGSEANFHGLIAAKLAGVPIRIGEEIGFPNHDWKWRLVFKWVYHSATKVIAISEAVKKRIVELGEVKAEKVEVVYNPVELDRNTEGDELQFEREENLQPISETFVFVTTCRLVAVKNLETLIEVFARLVNEDHSKRLRLWLVGDGPERKILEKLSGDLGITNKVDFWGYRADVVQFLENADAFVLPSYSEGFSISLVEAMICGLPCIVTNQGGPAEIITDGATGFLIDPQNPQEIQNVMRRMIDSSFSDRQYMGLRAKEAARRFSVKNYIQSLLTVYTNSSN